MKHTKGNWIVVPVDSYTGQLVYFKIDCKDSEGETIAVGFAGTYSNPDKNRKGVYVDIDEAEANAQLIASAPELLGVLKQILEAYDRGYQNLNCIAYIKDGKEIHIDDAIRQAIKKAEQ